LDKDEGFLKTFEVHQNYLLEAAEKLAKEKNIPLVCFQQENSSPSKSAEKLIDKLKKQDNL